PRPRRTLAHAAPSPTPAPAPHLHPRSLAARTVRYAPGPAAHPSAVPFVLKSDVAIRTLFFETNPSFGVEPDPPGLSSQTERSGQLR
ncbi:MAG TPA: hypothetical protein VNW92_01680, partial [Polyangiaceae bacterium]|nr:hypothetical protein [Polyangiaceae bacterium]